jgi:quercetin dioxygenase-like cupin family protein
MPATAGTTAEQRWFLNTLVSFPVAGDEGEDRMALMQSSAPHGDSPPLHVHENEDELFYVLEGVFRFRVGDEEVILSAGDSLLAPKGVPHTFRIESEGGGRWLVVTTGGEFERFVRSFSRPAERPELPEPAVPTPQQQRALAEACAAHGIGIVGPPLG